MARANFAAALSAVLVHEGGYADHPKDPGGATNMGITHRTLAEWRGKSTREVSKQDVRNLTKAEAGEIYRARYWNAVKGDDLPSGVDYAVFDFAVNSGPSRAAKFLQKVVRVRQDGKIGPKTLAAVHADDPARIVKELCAARLTWLATLGTFSTFGKGWTRRVTGVRTLGLSMVNAPPEKPTQPPKPSPAPSAPAAKPKGVAGLVGVILVAIAAITSKIAGVW